MLKCIPLQILQDPLSSFLISSCIYNAVYHRSLSVLNLQAQNAVECIYHTFQHQAFLELILQWLGEQSQTFQGQKVVLLSPSRLHPSHSVSNESNNFTLFSSKKRFATSAHAPEAVGLTITMGLFSSS